MKRISTIVLFLFLSINLFGQTDGITYQAVIIGPDVLELPGVDSEGNYLPTTDVAIKFSIIAPGSGVVEFTEIQNTTTDEFGRINLIIGAENHDDFEKIDWNGDPKSLKVEIDFNNGDGFVDMSVEKLTYVPYVAHRDITATGTLEVDDNTTLRGELTVVDKPTNLGGTFNVNGGNRSNLSGDLNVDGETNLNSTLNVNNKSATNLSGALTVGEFNGAPDDDAPTLLNGSLDVKGESTFGDLVATNLTVNESTTLNGETIINGGNATAIGPLNGGYQIKLQSSMPNNGNSIGNHPVLISGGANGLAIKVNGSRNNNTNFITFFDSSGVNHSWGRIEGENINEFGENADYLFDMSSLDYDIYDAWVDYGFALANEIIAGAQMVKAASDYRPCTGFGACIVTPGIADIVFSGLEMVSATAQAIASAFAIGRAEDNKNWYTALREDLEGVTYASGAGDYAEYLLRENFGEEMTYGDIVGMKGGKISKNTSGAERMMVVSYKPIVLGNAPEPNKEQHFEKVAFMGQVPVKVFGKVNIGDYILPSGKNDGIGKAISPADITIENINNIVGVAWATSNNVGGFNMVNVAVGLNKNDNNPIVKSLQQKVEEQAIEINNLKNEIAIIHEILGGNKDAATLTHSTSNAQRTLPVKTYDDRKHEFLDTDLGELVYFEITKSDIEKGFVMAQEQMLENGIDVENHPFWEKIKSDPNFKNEIIERMMSKLDKQFHYHKEISATEEK